MSDTEQNERLFQTKDALEAIFSRTSVRKYLPQPVEREKVELLLKAGMAAPSGKDVRPWELLVVDNRATLDAMAEGLPYAKMLRDAPVAIVVCGNTTKSAYWYIDCSTMGQNILLAADALGLGAVWTAAYPYRERMDIVRECVGLPEEMEALCVIPVGYPAKHYNPRDKWDEAKVHYNKW